MIDADSTGERMPPKKLFDLVVKIGERKDGSSVRRTVGCILESDAGPYMLLERWFSPAGVKGDQQAIMIHMYTPRPGQEYAPTDT